MAKFRVLLAGGGTGGHVYPLVAVARALQAKAQEKDVSLELRAIGSGSMMKNAFKNEGMVYRSILAGKLRRYVSVVTPIDLFIKLPLGIVQSLWHLFWFMPDVVFAKGGYASLPVTIAAQIFFIPVAIHESDSVPGIANRIISKFAQHVFVAFSSAQASFPKIKSSLVGNPVRTEIFGANRDDALREFNFFPETPTILILGGSQGAEQINSVILNGLVQLVGDYQIIHQCGESQFNRVNKEVEKIVKEGEGKYAGAVKQNYRFYAFLDDVAMAKAYAAADVVVSRAGASALFEIAQLGKPAVIIPLSGSAGGHQLKNAIEFEKFGAKVVEGANMTPNVLISQIQLLLQPDTRASVQEKIRGFATPEAANKIAEALLP